ncbi:MAG: hypothetical protein Ta2B_14940 [Termitinemataceae bacterium]|nr:MAG: hypothetical protein Ta2B_14940 [Termitinemataceae bacterium]
MVWEDQKKLSDAAFKELFGVKRKTFEQMLTILEKKYKESHESGGRPPKLSVCDKLRITLQYLREYRTMFHIACDWGVVKSTVCDSIKWVENTLIKDGSFSLPGKKVLRKNDDNIEFIVVDVTESPINRPKKNKKCITRVKKSGIR